MAKRKQAAKGSFTPTNPAKYFGGNIDKIEYRSSWELTCMMYFDKNPLVIGWASETCAIPYFNPFKKTHTVYVPDFVVVYQDRSGKKHAEMVEVKPKKEVMWMTEGKKSNIRDQAAQALNMVKWQAAAQFCAKRGVRFRVITEEDIYGTHMTRGKK